MRPTPNDVHEVWLDRVQIDHSIDAHDIDVIRALCEVCEPPLTVARLFELLQGEQNETVRRGLAEVIRQRAARGEGREVAECYVRMMLQRGARTLTAERVQKAVGVSLRTAGEVLMEYARGGVVRTRVSGRRVTVYRLQPAEGGQVSCEPVHWAGQDCCEPVHLAGQVWENPVQEEDSASGQDCCEPVHWAGQDCCEPVHLAGQVWENPVQEEDSASGQDCCEPVHWAGQDCCEPVHLAGQVCENHVQREDSAGVVDSCDHNLLHAVAALVGQPRVLLHAAARLVSTSRERALCVACDEIRRMLVLVRDEASAAACGARARGLLAKVARAEGARQEQPDQYRLDGLYTERELGWIPHILEFVEARGRVLPFYIALHLRDKLQLSRKEMEAVQDLVWRMARDGDAGLHVVDGAMVERVPLAREEAG
jgi:hypothetical protein